MSEIGGLKTQCGAMYWTLTAKYRIGGKSLSGKQSPSVGMMMGINITSNNAFKKLSEKLKADANKKLEVGIMIPGHCQHWDVFGIWVDPISDE
ncbi:MAG: hypothetical protein ACLSE8_15650 [Parasutterella sp.]